MTPGSTRAMRRAVSISRMPAMYFEKSRMTAALQHCPASDVPPPRASSGARWSRHRATGRDVFFVARNDDADRNLAVIGAVGRVESAAAGVEANFSAKMAVESGFKRGGVELRGLGRRWGDVLRHRAQNIFEDAGVVRKGDCRLPLRGEILDRRDTGLAGKGQMRPGYCQDRDR